MLQRASAHVDGGRRRVLRSRMPAARWRWSANPAAARPTTGKAHACSCCAPTGGGSALFDGVT